MTYKNYNWEIIANDYNSPFFRNYIWVKGLWQYPEVHYTSVLVCGIVSREGVLEYITDLKIWQKIHEELKVKALEDSNYFEELIDRSHLEGEKFNSWTEKNILNADLSKKTGEELSDLLDKFDDWQGKMYALGTALPVLDFQKFAYVENFLNDYLRKSVSKKDFKDFYALFTEPPANSFSQDQEEDLLNIMIKYWDFKNWRKDAETKNLAELKAAYPDFYEQLRVHTVKHAWVYYAYNGPESTEEDFLGFAKDYIVKLEHPERILKNLEQKRKKIEDKKQEFYKKYKPSDRERKMLEIAGKFVWGKPRRKDYQSKSYFHAKKLQLEIANRLHLSLNQMRHTPFDMIREALTKNTEIDVKIINSIIKYHIIVPNQDGVIEILHGAKAEEFYKSVKKTKEESFINQSKKQKRNLWKISRS